MAGKEKKNMDKYKREREREREKSEEVRGWSFREKPGAGIFQYFMLLPTDANLFSPIFKRLLEHLLKFSSTHSFKRTSGDSWKIL